VNSIRLKIQHLQDQLHLAGAYITGLVLRLFLAYEFAESGFIKLSGSNWFMEIQAEMPFPFSLFSIEFTWFLATWVELIGALLLLLGLATRYSAFTLLLLSLTAWYSVHTGYGYNICSNGYKMALIYCITLLPLILHGPGKLSIDHWLRQRH